MVTLLPCQLQGLWSLKEELPPEGVEGSPSTARLKMSWRSWRSCTHCRWWYWNGGESPTLLQKLCSLYRKRRSVNLEIVLRYKPGFNPALAWQRRIAITNPGVEPLLDKMGAGKGRGGLCGLAYENLTPDLEISWPCFRQIWSHYQLYHQHNPKNSW